MLAGILNEVTGQLDRRFLLNAFFPTVVFSIALMLAAAAGADGVGGAVGWWDGLGATVKALLILGWFAAVIVAANVLANKALGIVRLFEGHTLLPQLKLAELGKRRQHKKAKAALDDDGDDFQRRYPVHPRNLGCEDVLPTALGNVLLSAETYSQDRYGVDAVRVWPRLYHLLPETLRTSMAEARAAMELMLVVAFLAGVYTLLASIYLIATAGPLPWFLGSLLGGTALAFTAYWGALSPAAVYGHHVRAAFDLHRLELLASMQAPTPATLDEERRTWEMAISFLDGGHAHPWRYVKAPK
jgi:hypothetical protein